jgi:hypothetical protein
VLPHHLFRVANQFGYISRRNAFLQKDSHKSMAETMRLRRLFPLAAQFPDLVQLAPPKIRGRLHSRETTQSHKRALADSFLSQYCQTHQSSGSQVESGFFDLCIRRKHSLPFKRPRSKVAASEMRRPVKHSSTINAATSSPDDSPTPKPCQHFDPVTLSINSTRGRALYAVVRYA